MKWLVVLASVLAAIAQLFYKFSEGNIVSWWVLAGFALYCLTGVLVLAALRGEPLSRAFPILALSFVWVALLSSVFGESISSIGWLGVIAITAGVVLVGR